MKSVSMLRRTLCIAAAALLLVCAFSVSAFAANYVTAGIDATTTTNNLGVHAGPGEGYQTVGTLQSGYVVRVLETQDGWARINALNNGWVDINYLKANTPSGSTASGDYYGHTGYVTANYLNVRQGPGTDYMVCGTLQSGTKVNTIETRNGWGRITGGWVDLDYISAKPLNKPTFNSSNTDNSGSVGTSAKVRVTADYLNIRQGPGTGYTRVGQLTNGTIVDLEATQGNWGRTSQGWICLDYTVNAAGGSAYHSITNGSKVEVTAGTLWVREGAGTNYARVGSLNSGYRATILEVRGDWGRINNGWICLDYVRLI